MDKVNFNPFSEILVEDFLRQSGYMERAMTLLISDFLSQDIAVLGLDVTAQSTPDMSVYSKLGRLYYGGQQGEITINSNPPLVITAAHPIYDRIDRICAQYQDIDDLPETRNVMIDTVSRQVTQQTVMTRVAASINFMVVNGVAAPVPAAPAIPDGWISLAQVKVRKTATSILQTDILDERPRLKSLLSHAHAGGNDGAKIDWSSINNKPNVATTDVLAAFFDAVNGHKHDATTGNGPKLLASNILNTLISGLGTTDVQSTLASIYSEALRKGSSGSTRNAVITGPVSNGMANVLRDRYSGNLCINGTPISGGDLYDKSLAFDGNSVTVWGSSQFNTAVNGAAWLGYQFTTTKVIRKLIINQATDLRDAVTSIKIQRSTDGSTWNDVVTAAVVPGVNVIAVPAATVSAYWRVLANSNAITPTVGYAWAVFSLEMYELSSHEFTDSDIIVQPNALVAFAAGFDLVNKQPVDYWELTQQMSLTLAAADAYTVPFSYTDDLCNGGTPISGGDFSTSYASLAFDNIWDSGHQWQSLQNAANQLGVSYIGYNFGVAKAIRKIRIVNLSSVANIMSSLKAQYSNNGTVWVDAATVTISPVSSQDTIVTIPAVGAYQYWRLLANANNVSGITWAVLEIEMYEALQTYYVYLTRDANGNVTVGKSRNKPRTVKPANTASLVAQGYYTANLCSGGTPISGGDAAANTSKAQAFDNNADTFWISSQTGAAVNGVAWVGYNFGSPKVIRKVVLSMPAPNYIADSIKIQASTDGAIWLDQLTVNGLSAGGGGGLYTALIPQNAGYQYWRVLANANTVTGYGMAAHELYMMEYVEPITSSVQADDTTYSDNLCVGGAAIATSETNLKEWAFDGNSATYWVSNTTEALLSRAIGYDFGVARSIRKIIFTTHTNPDGVASAFKIQKSTDKNTWTDVLNYTGVVIGANVAYLPAGSAARYWRLLANGTKLSGSTSLSDGTSMVEITMHEISNDINLYDPIAGISKHYDGSTWDNVVRIFVGEAVVDSVGNIVSYTTYPYNKAKLKALPAEDSDDVVTLGQLTASSLANGWLKVPVMSNGLKTDIILQWGRQVHPGGSTNTNVALPISFPTVCLAVLLTRDNGSTATGAPLLISKSNTQIVFDSARGTSNEPCFWLAIGM